MATRYWVGFSGRWNSVTTTNWSTTSGGVGGASAPTSADDVIFNSASSGISYVVDCESGAVCKSITTTAPAVGTLTFKPYNTPAFTVFNGDMNIHAACLYDNSSGFFYISHTPTAAGTYTVTFNSPGTSTQIVLYTFTQASASTTLNFCNSNTATFRQIDISVGGTFISTNAVLANGDSALGSVFSCTFGGGATSVTMTGTTLNMTGSTTQVLTIGGSTTSTWAISTLAVNMTGFRQEYPIGNILSIGRDSATQPTAMGAVTFSNCAGNAWFARASTLGFSNTPGLTNNKITLATALTTSGALTLDSDSVLNNPSYAVSIGGITTLAGNASIYSTSNSASTTFTGAVTIANKGINPPTASTANTTTAFGTFAFLNGVTLTPTGTNSSYLLANIISADAITATNTFINATTSLTVNGGVGKAFSYTVNASAIPVLVIRQTIASGLYAFGTYEYPCISATSASITTPTTSFVGTNVRRVVYGLPRSIYKTSNNTLTISGSTPTLTNVTFLGTSINAGATNYTGTRLGTDGLSNGFLPATGVQKFVVTAVAADIDTAIWALTSGGATSADNYPLPQDTIIYGVSSNNNFVGYSGQIHIGSFDKSVVGNFLGSSAGVAGITYCYGSAIGTASGISGTTLLQLAQSGLTSRYVTQSGGNSFPDLVLDAGNSTTAVVSGTFGSNFYALSGTNDYLSGAVLGLSNGVVYFYSGSHTAQAVTFRGQTFTIEVGVVFPSSNYTVEASTDTTGTLSYTNSAPTTALNGSLSLTRNIFTGNTTITGTTSTNPLKSLTLINTVGSPFCTVSLASADIYVEALTNGTNSGWNISGGGGVRGFVKTNGGTASIANVFVNNVTASPANTFFATGTSTLTGTTTGWTLGAAPASPPSGGFLFI